MNLLPIPNASGAAPQGAPASSSTAPANPNANSIPANGPFELLLGNSGSSLMPQQQESKNQNGLPGGTHLKAALNTSRPNPANTAVIPLNLSPNLTVVELSPSPGLAPLLEAGSKQPTDVPLEAISLIQPALIPGASEPDLSAVLPFVIGAEVVKDSALPNVILLSPPNTAGSSKLALIVSNGEAAPENSESTKPTSGSTTPNALGPLTETAGRPGSLTVAEAYPRPANPFFAAGKDLPKPTVLRNLVSSPASRTQVIAPGEVPPSAAGLADSHEVMLRPQVSFVGTDAQPVNLASRPVLSSGFSQANGPTNPDQVSIASKPLPPSTVQPENGQQLPEPASLASNGQTQTSLLAAAGKAEKNTGKAEKPVAAQTARTSGASASTSSVLAAGRSSGKTGASEPLAQAAQVPGHSEEATSLMKTSGPQVSSNSDRPVARTSGNSGAQRPGISKAQAPVVATSGVKQEILKQSAHPAPAPNTEARTETGEKETIRIPSNQSSGVAHSSAAAAVSPSAGKALAVPNSPALKIASQSKPEVPAPAKPESLKPAATIPAVPSSTIASVGSRLEPINLAPMAAAAEKQQTAFAARITTVHKAPANPASSITPLALPAEMSAHSEAEPQVLHGSYGTLPNAQPQNPVTSNPAATKQAVEAGNTKPLVHTVMAKENTAPAAKLSAGAPAEDRPEFASKKDWAPETKLEMPVARSSEAQAGQRSTTPAAPESLPPTTKPSVPVSNAALNLEKTNFENEPEGALKNNQNNRASESKSEIPSNRPSEAQTGQRATTPAGQEALVPATKPPSSATPGATHLEKPSAQSANPSQEYQPSSNDSGQKNARNGGGDTAGQQGSQRQFGQSASPQGGEAAKTGGTLAAQQGMVAAFALKTETLQAIQGKIIPEAGKNDNPVGIDERILANPVNLQTTDRSIVAESFEESMDGLDALNESETAHEIWSAVKSFRENGSRDWEVKIRTDSNTQLHLKLQIQNGQIEIQARLERGEFDLLAAEWPELQRQFAERGIELKPLENSPSQTQGQSSNSSNAMNGDPKERAHSKAEREAAQSGRNHNQGKDPEAARNGSEQPKSNRLLETWA